MFKKASNQSKACRVCHRHRSKVFVFLLPLLFVRVSNWDPEGECTSWEVKSNQQGIWKRERAWSQASPGVIDRSFSRTLGWKPTVLSKTYLWGLKGPPWHQPILASPPGPPRLICSQRLKQRQSPQHADPPPSALQLLDCPFCSQFGCISISFYSFYQMVCSFLW